MGHYTNTHCSKRKAFCSRHEITYKCFKCIFMPLSAEGGGKKEKQKQGVILPEDVSDGLTGIAG